MSDKRPAVDLSNTEVWKSQHALHLKSNHLVAGHPVKVEIKVDFYDFQSYARVSVFEPAGLKWNYLDSIPYQMMQSTDQGDFAADEAELLRRAENILTPVTPSAFLKR